MFVLLIIGRNVNDKEFLKRILHDFMGKYLPNADMFIIFTSIDGD